MNGSMNIPPDPDTQSQVQFNDVGSTSKLDK